MSAPDLEAFFRTALSLGMPAHEVDRMRRDPQQVRSLIAARGSLPSPPPLNSLEGRTPDEIADMHKGAIEAARANLAAERERPQRFPPAADRTSTIVKTEQMRAQMARMDADPRPQLSWNFMGVSKHSSSTPLDQLKPSASAFPSLALSLLAPS